jgi:phenylacetate-CoA ligase
LEIVRDGEVVSPGEQGEIVITDLNNYVMPFIRYATGDLAVRGDLCACGNAFPLIRKIVGRSFEYLRAKNGDLIPLSGFTDGFGAQFLNDVVQFRFIDKGVGKLDVKIVPARELSQETRIKMERWLKHFVDEVDIEVVESIPWDRRWR